MPTTSNISGAGGVSGGGGGGGDASAANQLTAISRLDTLIADLATRMSEITGQDILVATQDVRDAVTGLGDSATLADLLTELGDIDSRLTADALVQSGIANNTQLSRLALQAIEPDIEEIRVDAEAQRVLLVSIDDRLRQLVDATRECPVFFASTGAQALPNTQGSLLSIALASGSTLTRLRIVDVRIRNLQPTAINGVIATFELRRFATHSGANVITPQPTDSSNVISSDITIRRGATLTGEGTAPIYPPWYMSTDEYASGGIEIESQAMVQQNTQSLIAPIRCAQYPTIRPGEGISVRLSTTLTQASLFEVSIQFTQE